MTWNPDSCSWKTSQRSLLGEDLNTSSVTLPRAGSMRSGAVSRRKRLELRTGESGCSSWPTIRAHEVGDYQTQRVGPPVQTLTGVAEDQWPTPRAKEDNCSVEATDARAARAREKYEAGEYGDNSGPPSMNSLNYATQQWTTPVATDRANRGNRARKDPSNHKGGESNLADDVQQWQFPGAMGGGSVSRGGDQVGEPLLAGQATAWQTPHTPTAHASDNSETTYLGRQVADWPTPNARDWKGCDLATRNGGASLSHAVETGEFTHTKSSPQDLTPTGAESPKPSGRRLNAAFVCWLMGAPWFWTRAEPISCGAEETELWRCKVQSHLLSLCGEP